MVEVVARLRAAGWTQGQIAEALARTCFGGNEDELAVVEEIMARRATL